MKDKVLNTLRKYSMLDGADKVIVALSGGSDSMALLGILCSLREKLNIEIEGTSAMNARAF